MWKLFIWSKIFVPKIDASNAILFIQVINMFNYSVNRPNSIPSFPTVTESAPRNTTFGRNDCCLLAKPISQNVINEVAQGAAFFKDGLDLGLWKMVRLVLLLSFCLGLSHECHGFFSLLSRSKSCRHADVLSFHLHFHWCLHGLRGTNVQIFVFGRIPCLQVRQELVIVQRLLALLLEVALFEALLDQSCQLLVVNLYLKVFVQ